MDNPGFRGEPPPPLPPAALQIGRWQVDPRADEISADGRVVKLEPLKMRLLLALASRPGDVLLTHELLDTVWRGVVVSPTSVYQGIAQLRRLLGDDAGRPAYIETVPRKGYRLVAPVRPVPAREAPREQGSAAARPDVHAPAAAAAGAAASPEWPVAAAAAPGSAGPAAARPLRRRGLLAAGAAAAAGLAAVRWWPVQPAPPSVPVRIAVLPFGGATSPRHQAIAEGLAIDVIRAFERHPQVQVVAPESALAFGSRLEDGAGAAARLGVAQVLAGEWTAGPAGPRVEAVLLGLPGRRRLWAQGFEAGAGGLAALPQAIAAAVAGHLGLAAPPEAAPASRPLQAYGLYLQAQHARRLKTAAGYALARESFERAIELEPGCASHLAGLACTLLDEAVAPDAPGWPRAAAEAMPLFARALQLDAGAPEALVGQSLLLRSAGQHEAARQSAARALVQHPGHAQAHLALGVAEHEDDWPRRAVPHLARAAELDPLSLAPLGWLGVASVLGGDADAAEAAFRREMTLDAEHPNAHWGLGLAGYARGALDQAVLAYREAIVREPRRLYLWNELAWLYLDLGLVDAARAAFGHTAAHLARDRWPRIDLAYAWIARPAGRPAPAELGLDGALPEKAYPVDVMLLRAMAGLPLDPAYLARGLAAMQAERADVLSRSWYVFLGHNTLLDLAAVLGAMGRADEARPHLARAERQLDELARRGLSGHAARFDRARLHALRGQAQPALAALAEAVSAGWRRSWWLRLDPAFRALREMPRLQAIVADVEQVCGRQRERLQAGCTPPAVDCGTAAGAARAQPRTGGPPGLAS